MKRIGILLGVLLLAAAVFLAAWTMIPRETQPEQPALMFRYADNQPKGYPTTQAADYFAELVEKRTDGKIVIRVFPDSVLGNEISVFRQMQFGGIDFARLSVSTLSEFVPEISILQLPYLFEDAEHMWRVLDGEIGKQLLESIRPFGLAGMSWFDAGSRKSPTNPFTPRCRPGRSTARKTTGPAMKPPDIMRLHPITCWTRIPGCRKRS